MQNPVKPLLTAIFFLISSLAQAATATEHIGYMSSMYVISGGTYDGYLVIEFWGSCKVITQRSASDATTTIENMGIWCSRDTTGHVPNITDDPLIMELDAIRMAGQTYAGSAMAPATEHLAWLALWYEVAVLPRAKAVVVEAAARGLNATNRKIAMGYFLFGFGVPYTQAAAVAAAWVDTSIKSKYDALGLAKMPIPAKDILREMSEAGAVFFD